MKGTFPVGIRQYKWEQDGLSMNSLGSVDTMFLKMRDLDVSEGGARWNDVTSSTIRKRH
jgi:hypothetical protein